MDEQVDISISIDIPGQEHRRVTAEWPVNDEPAPHRAMAANVLRRLADELDPQWYRVQGPDGRIRRAL